jgi:hypothetical protein
MHQVETIIIMQVNHHMETIMLHVQAMITQQDLHNQVIMLHRTITMHHRIITMVALIAHLHVLIIVQHLLQHSAHMQVAQY